MRASRVSCAADFGEACADFGRTTAAGFQLLKLRRRVSVVPQSAPPMRKKILILFSLPAALAGAWAGAEPTPKASPPDRFHLSDLLPRPMQKNQRLNLSIVTELTDDGKKVAAPTKDRPAFYTVLDGG